MPLYDFRCACGNTFEALAKPDEPRDCPCGLKAERQIGAPAFALKGSGYYDKGRSVAGKPSKDSP